MGVAKSLYQRMIDDRLGPLAEIVDARHVEAWMRVEHPTLDALSHAEFSVEVCAAVECIAEAGAIESESLAQSFGL
jgi:hypothetical protein